MNKFGILLISVIVGHNSCYAKTSCTPVTFNSGSLKQMDMEIEKYEMCVKNELMNNQNFIDRIAVQRIVDTYNVPAEDKQKIIKYALLYAKKYKIDPITLVSVLAKESSLRKDIEHAQVFVKIPTKRHWTETKTAKVKAVGLGGVIFEIWKYELSDIDIKKRSQLFNIKDNIKATSMILSTYQNERKQIKGSASKEESALLRYYGVIRKSGAIVKTYAKQVYKIRS